MQRHTGNATACGAGVPPAATARTSPAPAAGTAAPQAAGQVVLHADDFGFGRAITDGILHAFRHGLLTSTSLLANAPDAERALDQWLWLREEQEAGCLPSADARRRLGDPCAAFDLGIHLNLTQGRPLSGAAYPRELCDAAGRFCGIWTLFRRLRRPRPEWLAALKNELARQIERPLDRGLRPTHLNGHQYVEMLPAVAAMLPELLAEYAIPVVRVAAEPALFRSTVLRNLAVPQWLLARVKRRYARRFGRQMDALGIAHADAYFGTAHAGRIGLGLLRTFLAGIARHVGRSIAPSQDSRPVGRSLTPSQKRRSETPPYNGRSDAPSYGEIGLHPGFAPASPSPQDLAAGWRDPLAAGRPRELQMLVSPDLADAIESQRLHLGRLIALAGAPIAFHPSSFILHPLPQPPIPGLTPEARHDGARLGEEV